MAWIHLVTILALFQFLLFGALVGRARVKYKVQAPATTGNEMFERYYRVQMNTLELLAAFLPALWIATTYWDPRWMAAVGAVYLLGRMLYLRAYTTEPRSRGLAYMLSLLPVMVLMAAGLAGVMLSTMRGAPG